MFFLDNFYSIKVGLDSPEQIREWSYGEVTNIDIFDSETKRPVDGGILCERIFGTTKNWECRCGKYKGIEHRGVICEDCGVEVTHSKVRRERMGHINLAKPVLNIGYLNGLPSRVGILLDLEPLQIRDILDGILFIVTNPGTLKLKYKQVITFNEYLKLKQKYGEDSFEIGTCAESIKKLLADINLEEELKVLDKKIKKAYGHEKDYLLDKRNLINTLIDQNARPEWMVFDALPVIPPEYRPIYRLENGNLKVSNVSEHYRKIVYRNDRLKKLLELGAPDIIWRNEYKILQENVDALINEYRIRRRTIMNCSSMYDSMLDFEDNECTIRFNK